MYGSEREFGLAQAGTSTSSNSEWGLVAGSMPLPLPPTPLGFDHSFRPHSTISWPSSPPPLYWSDGAAAIPADAAVQQLQDALSEGDSAPHSQPPTDTWSETAQTPAIDSYSGMVSPLTPLGENMMGQSVPPRCLPSTPLTGGLVESIAADSPVWDIHLQSTDSSSSTSSPAQSARNGTSLHQSTSAKQNLMPSTVAVTQEFATNTPPTDGGSSASGGSSEPRMARRACTHCRRLKTSCCDQRPCARCVKHGRECVDRPDEEVEAARLRRARAGEARSKKRAMAHANVPVPPPVAGVSATVVAAAHAAAATEVLSLPPAHAVDGSASTTAALDATSLALFSRAFMLMGIKSGLRDSILTLHAQLLSSSLPVSALVEWHTQVAQCMLQLSDQMLEDDFLILLTDSLTPAQMSSSNWLTSPLPQWTRLSTRPLHYAIQPNTLALEEHLGGANSAAAERQRQDEDPLLARMTIQWLPTTHTSFQRWQRMLTNKLCYEQDLRAARSGMQMIGPVPSLDADDDDDSSHLHHDDEEDDDLAARFGVLGITRSLSKPPPIPGHHDRVQFIHANWCPVSEREAALEDALADAPNAKRAHAAGIHPADLSGATAAAATAAVDAECLCSFSTPMPARIYVNSTFEKLFGWRRIEVERGMRQEGFRWNRRWYPPSEWPRAHLGQMIHWKLTLEHVVRKLLRQSSADLQPVVSSCAQPVPAVASTSFMTRHGTIVPADGKTMRVQETDGVHEAAAIVVTWRLPGAPAPAAEVQTCSTRLQADQEATAAAAAQRTIAQLTK